MDLHINETLLAGYQRAKILYNGIFDVDKLALNTSIVPHWIDQTHCCWYRRKTWQGLEFRLVDASLATNEQAFDHQLLANLLTDNLGQTVDANNLPITNVEISVSPAQVCFSAFDRHYTFDIHQQDLKETPPAIPAQDNSLISPDGRQAAFVRDHNLWLQNLETGEEQPLTHDGEPHYAYATSPVAISIQASWSPDSKRLFTLQSDKRQVKATPILHHIPEDGSLRPHIQEHYCAYPGDEHLEEVRLVVIDVATNKIQAIHYGRVPVKRFGFGLFTDQLAWWSQDSSFGYFVDLARNGQTARVVELDAHSGSTRILFEETSNTFIQLSANELTPATLQPLPDTDELIWYSERSGWAHLYLYDLKTGVLKHAITQGDWLVRDILHVDIKRRELWIQTAGRVHNRDPYYRDICRVHIDTGELTTLAAGDTEYNVFSFRAFDYFWHSTAGLEIGDNAHGVSADAAYIVACHSRIDQTPVSQLLDRNGKVLLDLEVADLSKMPEGWRWPEPVKLTAADGKTAIYGAVFKPADFLPDKRYPVIDGTLCLPELNMTPKGLLRNDTSGGGYFLQAAALAELGFIVIIIDGRGTPSRGKAFSKCSYGSVPASNNTDDRIAGIKQLAKQRPYMDMDRVGFVDFGSDGGTLFRYPDFYKVSVCTGVLDTRLMATAFWGDHYEGEPGAAIAGELAEQLVSKLQGKLLLMHGLLDSLAPPACTFRLVEALQKDNKDFDMLFLPKGGHGAIFDPYACRRTWDYFVKHLQGVEPPKEFNLGSSS